MIVNVRKNSQAYKKGLREGDLLFQINNSKVLKASDVKETLQKGKTYQFHVLRYYKQPPPLPHTIPKPKTIVPGGKSLKIYSLKIALD